MHSLDPVPAVRRIETDRGDACAFEVVGHVSAADVENLYGLLEGAYALHPQIDLLIRMVDFEGIDWSEVSPETRQTGREHAFAHVRRCAAVGDPDWTGEIGGWFSEPPPGEVRHFPADQEAEAWGWIGAREVPQRI